LIKQDKVRINQNAIRTALDDFGWQIDDIKRCLLKLNNRYHFSDTDKNHFYKTEEHRYIPNTKMDYYKAKNIMEKMSVYTHLYIHPESGELIISSFKELEVE
jgi:hypothetical protein